MQVRLATLDDTAFILDSAVKMAHETEGKTLDQTVVHKGIQDCIKQPLLGSYYIVEDEAKTMLGTLMLTYEISV